MRLIAVILLLASTANAQERSMILASTTSTQNSGLLDAILPIFEAATGIHVFVVAVGTGQAMRIARNGDADAILVHHRPSEDAFIANGFGVNRVDVMYNDFVIIGPRHDPANIRDVNSAANAFELISITHAQFISRGDNSGTHLKEQEIWQQSGLEPLGNWYLEVGAGMGAALNLASSLDAYILADRGTWLSFNNHENLEVLFSDGGEMRNPYGYIQVSSARFPHVKATESAALGAWLTSAQGQGAIAAFRIDDEQLFCPIALAAQNQQQNSQSACPADALQR